MQAPLPSNRRIFMVMINDPTQWRDAPKPRAHGKYARLEAAREWQEKLRALGFESTIYVTQQLKWSEVA